MMMCGFVRSTSEHPWIAVEIDNKEPLFAIKQSAASHDSVDILYLIRFCTTSMNDRAHKHTQMITIDLQADENVIEDRSGGR